LNKSVTQLHLNRSSTWTPALAGRHDKTNGFCHPTPTHTHCLRLHLNLKCLFHHVHTSIGSEIMKTETQSAWSSHGRHGGKVFFSA